MPYLSNTARALSASPASNNSRTSPLLAFTWSAGSSSSDLVGTSQVGTAETDRFGHLHNPRGQTKRRYYGGSRSRYPMPENVLGTWHFDCRPIQKGIVGWWWRGVMAKPPLNVPVARSSRFPRHALDPPTSLRMQQQWGMARHHGLPGDASRSRQPRSLLALPKRIGQQQYLL